MAEINVKLTITRTRFFLVNPNIDIKIKSMAIAQGLTPSTKPNKIKYISEKSLGGAVNISGIVSVLARLSTVKSSTALTISARPEK